MAPQAQDIGVNRLIFDSYAVLAMLLLEDGAARVRELLYAPGPKWMSVVNLGEVYYKAARRFGDDVAQDMIDQIRAWPIVIVDADQALTLEAAKIKSAFALSYADCFAAALARRMKARVVTGDPEFAKLEKAKVTQIEWLPPHRRKR